MYTDVNFEASVEGVCLPSQVIGTLKNYIETMAYENIPNLQYKLQATFLMKNRHATKSGLKFLAINMYHCTAQAKLQGVVCVHS